MIGSGQGIRQIRLPAETVTAVLRLPVDGVTGDADGIRLLRDQRDVVAAGPVPGRHGGRDLVRSGVSGVDSVVFVYQRLMPFFIGAERTGAVERQIHSLPALVVQAQNGRHHVPTGRGFQRGRAFLLISDGPGRRPSSGAESGHVAGTVSTRCGDYRRFHYTRLQFQRRFKLRR